MTTPIEALAISIAGKSFTSILAGMISSYFSRKIKSIGQDKASVTADLRPHMEATFERCLNIKTILNDAPVNLLSIYVEQRFAHRGEGVDQYELIDRVRGGRCLVVSGIGGGGKPMFMRYLWLSFFVHSENKIPIFFELRQINAATHDSFINHIFHSVLQTKSKITQQQFEDGMTKGEFVLFLDGFDEILLDKRDSIERKILDLKDNNPKLTVVITTRPDDRFSGWHRFDNAEVSPLTKEDSLLLVDRAEYDEPSKKRLQKRINGGLFDTHESFLSNPLLVYMMLLTIARNPDIPNKMHAFYEMAFDALYHRHDTSKGGFIRQFHTKLEKQQFIKHLSYFCLITYHDEVTEADEMNIIDYVGKAIKFDGSNTEADSYLKDLVESVCVLKKDGIAYNFIHRSFQEYFSAVCICRYASRNLEKLFLQFSRRYNDKVLSMVYDMDPDLFREKYILPVHSRNTAFLDGHPSAREDLVFIKEAALSFVAHRIPDNVKSQKKSTRSNMNGQKSFSINLEGHNELYGLYSNLNNLEYAAGNFIRNMGENEKNKRKVDDKFFVELSKEYAPAERIVRVTSDGENIVVRIGENLVRANDKLKVLFGRTYMSEYCERESLRVKKFVGEEISKYQKITSSFDEYL